GELVHRPGQFLAQSGQQAVARQAGQMHQPLNPVLAERLFQLRRRDGLVRAARHPALRLVALPILPELVEQVLQAAGERAAAENATQQSAAPQTTRRDSALW